MSSELELLKKVREYFLAERTKQEMMVKEWAAKLEQVDPLILKDVDLPIPLELKTLMPELYANEPNQEQYKKEYDAAMALFAEVNRIADKYNEEAKKCLLDYQAMSSR